MTTTLTNNLSPPPAPPLPPPPPPPATEVKPMATAQTMMDSQPSTASAFPSRKTHTPNPSLRFSPYAWAKLLAFRDAGPTEIAGFGVAHAGDDPLLVEDFVTVPQQCTAVTAAMNDEAVADYFDQQVELGRRPKQFARIWLHTHPGMSANPSGVDEETFERVFGDCDWAVMAILACGGQTYARLRFGVGPGAQVLIPVQVDFSVPFPGADHESWGDEFERNIMPAPEPALRQLSEQTVAAAERGEGRKKSRRRPPSTDWQVPDYDDIHNQRDAEALAELEAELAARGYFDEEVPFDTR